MVTKLSKLSTAVLIALGYLGTQVSSNTIVPLTYADAETSATTEGTACQPAGMVFSDKQTCTTSEACSSYPYYECVDSQCVHKDLFPQEGLEIAGVFVFGFIMALCTVAGIGGGGIAISMLIAFFKFDTKPAVAISSFSILVCTTMRFFYNFNTKNPEKPKMNVLDYGLASIMMPTTLAGSQIGGYILLLFPALYIQVALTLLLAFLSYQTTKKGLQLHRKEVAAKAGTTPKVDSALVDESKDGLPTQQSFLDNSRQEISASMSASASASVSVGRVNETMYTSGTASVLARNQSALTPSQEDAIQEETNTPGDKKNTIIIGDKTFELGTDSARDEELHQLKAIADRESGQKQFVKQGICFFLIICVILVNFLQPSQSQTSPIGIKICSAIYWLLEALFIIACVVMTYVAIKISAKEQDLKMKYGINYNEGDVIFKGKALTILVCIGFIGGLVAGALGLGGGSIYNPALLTLGVHPRVSGATGMFLVLFSTVNTCLINFLNGFLDIKYACWISMFALAGSILGMAATDKVVKVTGKPSIMVWVLVFVFIISTISTPIFGGFSLRDQAADGDDIYAFNPLCIEASDT